MGAALGPSLPGGALKRAAQGQAVVDASWAMAARGDGTFDRWQLFGATALQYVHMGQRDGARRARGRRDRRSRRRSGSTRSSRRSSSRCSQPRCATGARPGVGGARRRDRARARPVHAGRRSGARREPGGAGRPDAAARARTLRDAARGRAAQRGRPVSTVDRRHRRLHGRHRGDQGVGTGRARRARAPALGGERDRAARARAAGGARRDSALADGKELAFGADTVGVVAGGVLAFSRPLDRALRDRRGGGDGGAAGAGAGAPERSVAARRRRA